MRGRAREKLDFGEPEPRKRRENEREENEGVDVDKENFAVPWSPAPKQQPKTPAQRASATRTSGKKVVGMPAQKVVGTPQSSARDKSPVVKKLLQQLASLDDSGGSLSLVFCSARGFPGSQNAAA